MTPQTDLLKQVHEECIVVVETSKFTVEFELKKELPSKLTYLTYLKTELTQND